MEVHSGREISPQPTFSWVWNLILILCFSCNHNLTPAEGGVGFTSVRLHPALQFHREIGIGKVICSTFRA